MGRFRYVGVIWDLYERWALVWDTRYKVFASVHCSCVCASGEAITAELRSRAEAQYNLHPPPHRTTLFTRRIRSLTQIYPYFVWRPSINEILWIVVIWRNQPLHISDTCFNFCTSELLIKHTHTHITKFNKLGNKYKVQNSPNKPRLLYLVSKIRCPVSLHCWPLAVFKNLLFLGYSGYLFLSTENTIIDEMLNAQGKTKMSHHLANCYGLQ